MITRTWHKGPPPHVGWWNASAVKAFDCWRWWDGKCWSAPAYPKYSARTAAAMAQKPGRWQYKIEWSDYYPENARVPRSDPAERRPGLWALVMKIQEEHPNWSPESVVTEAKLQWHRQQRQA